MGVRIDDDAAWDVLAESHTGILTTLRRDGWPVSLPVWFAVIESSADRAIFVRTPAGSKKVTRITRDIRACFLVEAGLAWRELRAVVAPVRATIETDPELCAAAIQAVDEKYADFTTPPQDMPARARAHYAQETAVIRLDPEGPFVTWDNRLLFQPEAAR